MVSLQLAFNQVVTFTSEKMSDNKLIIISESEQQTFEWGRRCGQLVAPSTVVGLGGTLGAGKTRLTQGIVAGVLGETRIVVSPTFTLCIPYSGRVELLHLDAYRISDDDEVYELGLDESVEQGHVLVIEWIERIRETVPLVDLDVQLEVTSETSRNIVFTPKSDAGKALITRLSATN